MSSTPRIFFIFKINGKIAARFLTFKKVQMDPYPFFLQYYPKSLEKYAVKWYLDNNRPKVA